MPDPSMNIGGSSHASFAMAVPPKPRLAVSPPVKTQSSETSIDLGNRHPAESSFKNDRKPDESTVPGPPPAFETSLLEFERDIDIALKRLATRRSEKFGAYHFQNEPARGVVDNEHSAASHSETRPEAPETALALATKPQDGGSGGHDTLSSAP